MKKYTVSFIALLAVCFLFTSCIFDLFDSGDNDDDSSSTSAEQSSSESQTAAEQYDANTFVQLENCSLYTVRVFRDSARGSAICTLKSGEKFVTGAKQTVEGTVYYLSYFVDVGMAVPWFDTNSVCYAAPKTGQTVSAFIYNPYSITTKNCYVVLENKSIETVVLKKGASELLPANDNPSVILPPEATGIYEIKTVDFANFAVFNICTAGGLMIAHLSSFISKLEANRIYNVEISLQGGHAVPELKTVMPFDSAVKSKDCVITYQSERGTAPEPKTFSVGNALTAEYLPSVKADGYVFAGWYIGNTKVDSTYFVQSDITLSAQWTLQTYSIKYVLDGGTNSSENPSTYTIESEPITLKNPEKDECDFAGWYATSDFSGDSASVIPTGSFGDRTLFAKWRVLPKYTATFNTNGGTVVASVTRARVNEAPKPKRTGYALYGWYLDSNFSTRATFPYLLKQDTTFYAKWVECTDIAYRVEHLKQSENLSSYTLADSESLTGTTGTKTAVSAKSYTGFHAKSFEQKEIEADGSTVLKIYYNRNRYTINFNANGGTGSLSSQTFYYGISQKLTASTFKKSGYSFAGWAKNANGSAVYTNSEAIVNLSELNDATVTLYAVWKKFIATAENISELDCSGLTEPYSIKIKGNITSETLLTLGEKLAKASADITLDLSEATGITELNSELIQRKSGDIIPNEKLKSVILPKCLKKIGNDAFCFYTALESVVLPAGLTSIGNSVFVLCKNLKSIDIPDTVTEIGKSAFWKCTSLESITIPNNVKTIGEQAFYNCENLESIIIPNNVTEIGIFAFSDCKKLKEVTLSNNLTKLNNGVFQNCFSLSDIKIPDSITEIGTAPFYGCFRLTSITIPKNVTKIEYNAFSHMNLEAITIPSSVTKIGSGAFYGCDSLQKITFEDTSTWYASDSSDYKNGFRINVTSPTTNATYFKSTIHKYWYKE